MIIQKEKEIVEVEVEKIVEVKVEVEKIVERIVEVVPDDLKGIVAERDALDCAHTQAYISPPNHT